MEEEEIKQKEIDKVLFDSIANKECETKEENKTVLGTALEAALRKISNIKTW